MSCRICEINRIIPAIRVSIQRLRIHWALNDGIRRNEPAQQWRVITSAVEHQASFFVERFAGEVVPGYVLVAAVLIVSGKVTERFVFHQLNKRSGGIGDDIRASEVVLKIISHRVAGDGCDLC